MQPIPSPQHDAPDDQIIRLLKELGSSASEYPAELLAARRAAFLEQVAAATPVEIAEELSAGDQEIVRLLGKLKSVPVEYPAELLAARRAALLRQAAGAGQIRLLDRLWLSIGRLFPQSPALPSASGTGFLRTSLVVATFLAFVLMGSFFLSRAGPGLRPSPSQAAVEPTGLPPAGTAEVTLVVCKPGDSSSACSPEQLTPDQDLADSSNGTARPAVAKDARPGAAGVRRAAVVNDGRRDGIWVSDSPDSWIKIDLGQVRTINTVSLQSGIAGPSGDSDPGQFVIAVALSDVYSDGDNHNDFVEYAQVFNSEETGFSGNVSQAETITTRFPPTPARYVKITFKKAGAAIQEVGVFMAPPAESVEQATSTPQADLPEAGLTSSPTDTPLPTETIASLPAITASPVDTAAFLPTDLIPPSSTPTPLPTGTQAPADTLTPVPTDPLPSDTPIPSPTEIPATVIPPTVMPAPEGTEPIVVTGNDQTLTFTCSGNVAEIRGHSNTVTLWGSCSNITVTGNGNRVFWQSGSPVITNNGQGNIITQR